MYSLDYEVRRRVKDLDSVSQEFTFFVFGLASWCVIQCHRIRTILNDTVYHPEPNFGDLKLRCTVPCTAYLDS